MARMNSIPTRELPRVAWRRVLREVRSRIAPRRPKPIEVSDDIQAVVSSFRQRAYPRFFGLIPEQAALIAQFFPEAADETVYAARAVLEHRFDILGSGEVELGAKIDWHTDFKSGHRWPLKHHTRLNIVSPNGGYDVKVPWELSRFHHLLRLGQTYLYLEEEQYAEEIIAQVKDWVEANPYEFGVNWAGPMDVAIRAVNWIWALFFILESEALTDDVLALWLKSLHQHGEYIEKHLEDTWPRTNHLIANLTGLAYIGIMFPEFPEAEQWQETGLERLWQELDSQINPDGLDYEASIGYHRLVTEMTLHVMALCVLNGIEVPATAQARIRTMLDAIMLYTQPDGLAPQIGDFDSGRLLPLSAYQNSFRESHDHRYLLALGSIVLERESPDWAGYVDPTNKGWAMAAGYEWQDAFWLFASDASARYTDTLLLTTTQPDDIDPDAWVDVAAGIRVRARALARRSISIEDLLSSHGLESSGLYIMRDKSFHMTIDAGTVGTRGEGGHAHNDIFSVTAHAYGATFIADPGSYLYTSDPETRNAFRSTAFHNTLQIGAEEIIPLPQDEMFRLPGEARIRINQWVSNEDFDLLDASHDNYLRLEPAVRHRRLVFFDKHNRLWLVRDILEPQDPADDGKEVGVTIRFHLLLHEVHVEDEGLVRAVSPGGKSLLIFPMEDTSLRTTVRGGWFSPRYGEKTRIPVATFLGPLALGEEVTMLLLPRRDNSDVDLRAVRMVGQNAMQRLRRVVSPSGRFLT